MARLSPVTPTTPPPAHLVIGTYLRALRNAREETLNTVRTRTRHQNDIGTLSRMERALVPLEPKLVRELLLGYGLASHGEADAVTHLLHARGTFHDLTAGACDRIAACERAATAIRIYSSVTVPPLARIPAYAVAADRWRPSEPPQSVQLGLSRAWNPKDDRSIQLLLDEAVLHRPMGNHRVMANQCAHLQDLMERHQLPLRILPFGAEGALGGTVTYELMLHGHQLYANQALDYVAYTTNPQINDRFDLVQATSLSSDDTYELIDRARTAFEAGNVPPIPAGGPS